MFRLLASCLAFLVLSGPLWAQIKIAPEHKDRAKIVASIGQSIPDGAEVKGPGFRCVGAQLWQPPGSNQVAIWAAPGEYLLTYEVMWIQVQANDQGEIVLVGWDWVKEEAPFTVTGKVDPPDPPPPPPGNRWGIIVEETQDRTPAQAYLFQQLRLRWPAGQAQRVDLKDQDLLPPTIAQAVREANLALPVLVSLDKTDGSVVGVAKMPATLDGIAEVLGYE